MWGCALAWETGGGGGGNWSLKIENCETSSLGKLKISGDLSYHEEKWQIFQKFIINARNRDKMVQSSLFHYAKCNHWAPKTGLQLKRGGEEGTNLRFAKAQGAEGHLLCLSIFEKEALYSIYIVGILCTSLDSYLFLWKLLKLAVVTSFWPFPFLPISMSECLWSLEYAQNLEWKILSGYLWWLKMKYMPHQLQPYFQRCAHIDGQRIDDG